MTRPRIVFGSYMIRYPLGGMMSYVLQYLVGLQRLGCDVWFVERGNYPNACFDPSQQRMSDDASYGIQVVSTLLDRFDLADRWCFVDYHGRYHGLTESRVRDLFASADLFLDMGTHGSWIEHARATGTRVLIDGEPGFNQIKMAKAQAAGDLVPEYDAYYTNGMNVGTDRSNAPTAGRAWRHLFHPVVVDLFADVPPPQEGAPFTTLMNWQSHDPIEFNGVTYGQKDVEFEQFIDLPSRVDAPLAVAASGPDVPTERLAGKGWKVENGHDVSVSYDSFRGFIARSAAEFSVCKNVFVALNTGWFSDRSAAYLASGRPVIMQETGFSEHLPTGDGLFAVRDVDEAAAAIEEVRRRPGHHAARAREIARTHLSADVVLSRFLYELAGFQLPTSID